MVKTFEVGDHVSWNSEAGRVRGKIVKVHKGDVNYKGHIHHDPTSRSMKSRATRPITSPCTRPEC